MFAVTVVPVNTTTDVDPTTSSPLYTSRAGHRVSIRNSRVSGSRRRTTLGVRAGLHLRRRERAVARRARPAFSLALVRLPTSVRHSPVLRRCIAARRKELENEKGAGSGAHLQPMTILLAYVEGTPVALPLTYPRSADLVSPVTPSDSQNVVSVRGRVRWSSCVS